MHEQRWVLVPGAATAGGSLLRQHLPCGFVHTPELAFEPAEDGGLPGPRGARKDEEIRSRALTHGRRVMG